MAERDNELDSQREQRRPRTKAAISSDPLHLRRLVSLQDDMMQSAKSKSLQSPQLRTGGTQVGFKKKRIRDGPNSSIGPSGSCPSRPEVGRLSPALSRLQRRVRPSPKVPIAVQWGRMPRTFDSSHCDGTSVRFLSTAPAPDAFILPGRCAVACRAHQAVRTPPSFQWVLTA